MASACALAMFSGRIIFSFGIAERLRAFRYPIFTGEKRNGNWQLPRWFPTETSARRANACSPGGAVAQRLRGYKWRSEKSVKAIAPTGAALAFLCFDFFFRIVKGEQPLARCGVGGVQR